MALTRQMHIFWDTEYRLWKAENLAPEANVVAFGDTPEEALQDLLCMVEDVMGRKEVRTDD